MTETIKFPSENYPGIPAVSLTLPENWSGAPVAAHAPPPVRSVDEGQFVSTAIVRTQRVVSADDLAIAAAVVDAGIAELDEVEDISRTTLETDGRQVYCREFAYRHPQAGTLAQAWRVLAVQHDGVTDI